MNSISWETNILCESMLYIMYSLMCEGGSRKIHLDTLESNLDFLGAKLEA